MNSDDCKRGPGLSGALLAFGVGLAVIAGAGWLAERQTRPAPQVPAPMHAEAPRSGKWPAVERKFLAEHPTCALCGRKGTADNPLNVHHRIPFHTPEGKALELEPSNLIVLCREHHLLAGHLLNWSSWNVDVAEDCVVWRKKIENRP